MWKEDENGDGEGVIVEEEEAEKTVKKCLMKLRYKIITKIFVI
jgi:hypothetical protein